MALANTTLVAPAPGTLSALSETKANVAELVKFGLRDNMDYEQAAGMLKHVKHNLKKLEEFEEDEKRPLLTELDKIRDKYKPLRKDWEACEASIKQQVSAYHERLAKDRLEAQRLLEEAAAAERAKLQKKAEKAVKAGKHEQAALIADQAASVVAPVVQQEVAKVEGVSTYEVWECEVTEPDKVPKEYWMIDLKGLKKVVKTLKSAAKSIPGIRVWPVTKVRSASEQPEI